MYVVPVGGAIRIVDTMSLSFVDTAGQLIIGIVWFSVSTMNLPYIGVCLCSFTQTRLVASNLSHDLFRELLVGQQSCS